MAAIVSSPAVPATTAGLARRLAARFALFAFAAYHVPLFVNDFPSLGGGGTRDDGLAHVWGHVFTPVGLWVARHVFHLAGAMSYAREGDNGDTAEEYCRLLVGVLLAAVVASAWTVADRRAPRGRWVEEALRVLLRYSIALGLASYAMAKLLPLQFGELGPVSLEMRVGELPPAALLWRFMEASQAYSVFGGVAEMVAVVLLCFRRTTLLGALVCIPVMVNVAMMNLCYGVPVKLYSCSIVVSAAVIVLLDARRLADVLVFHRPTVAPPLEPPFRSRRLNQARWALKAVLVGGVLLSSYVEMRHLVDGRLAQHTSPLYGVWRVTSFVRDGQELATTGDAARWRRMAYEGGRAIVRLEDDALLWCQGSEAGDTHVLGLRCQRGDDARTGELHWSGDGAALRMEGTFDGAPVSMALSRVDESKMPLLRARFRWMTDVD